MFILSCGRVSRMHSHMYLGWLKSVSYTHLDVYKRQLAKLCDDKSHLKSPVTEMHITNHIVSHELCDTLNALSDYCRTKAVSYTHLDVYKRQ